MRKLYVLTEEYPNIDEIRLMIELCGYKIPLTFTNKDIKPKIKNEENRKFNGEWEIIGKSIKVNIKLFKGKTSSVDYLLFDNKKNLEKGDANDALVILESTKTSDNSSRNTSVFQRITKFMTYKKMYPKSNAKFVMFWGNSDWGAKLTPTAQLGMRMMATLSIYMYSCNNNKNIDIKKNYKIQPFKDADDFIKSKNSIKQKSKNTSIRIERDESDICIYLKLDKGKGKLSGKITHDPNVGFLSGAINCFNTLDTKNEINKYIIKKHNIKQDYFDKCPSSKLWHSTNGIKIEFDECKIKKQPKLPDRYFIIDNNVTEKMSTILCDIMSKDETIFSNHGSCALTEIKGIDKDVKVGRLMTRPDIVFTNKEKKEILIVEGKIENEIIKGVKQLSNEHLKDFINKVKDIYKDYKITKGLCITISDINKIDKYFDLKYPIKFAIDKKGYFIDLR